jgi:hypothetical protein
LVSGVIMLLLRLGSIGVSWIAKRLGVDERKGLTP